MKGKLDSSILLKPQDRQQIMFRAGKALAELPADLVLQDIEAGRGFVTNVGHENLILPENMDLIRKSMQWEIFGEQESAWRHAPGLQEAVSQAMDDAFDNKKIASAAQSQRNF